jgi:FG-GAP-like repeat
MLKNTEGGPPFVTMVKIDTLNHSFYVAYRNKRFIETYNSSFKKIDSSRIENQVSDILFENGEKYLLQMGIMDPNDTRKGKLSKITTNQNTPTTLVDSLQRPVNLAIFDINQDGTNDYLICNYGNLTGKLAWYDGKTHQETVLKPLPGARNTVVKDMDNDGQLDIVVLMCQAREGVSIFYNKGKGIFEEDIVLQFTSVYGSSYMELADMNGDGRSDIVYTNGDNADYSMVLKPYHGVRIFINDGKNAFKEQFFYPIYGASKVITRDFDKDGDLDMATTAFFPDAEQKPNEGFLFFENKGNNVFNVSTFTNANNGKWLVMDVGDLDGDGKADILLGSYAKGKISPTSVQIPTVVWLKNTSK